jgi:hypothetical protein
MNARDRLSPDQRSARPCSTSSRGRPAQGVHANLSPSVSTLALLPAARVVSHDGATRQTAGEPRIALKRPAGIIVEVDAAARFIDHPTKRDHQTTRLGAGRSEAFRSETGPDRPDDRRRPRPAFPRWVHTRLKCGASTFFGFDPARRVSLKAACASEGYDKSHQGASPIRQVR